MSVLTFVHIELWMPWILKVLCLVFISFETFFQREVSKLLKVYLILELFDDSYRRKNKFLYIVFTINSTNLFALFNCFYLYAISTSLIASFHNISFHLYHWKLKFCCFANVLIRGWLKNVTQNFIPIFRGKFSLEKLQDCIFCFYFHEHCSKFLHSWVLYCL